MYIIIGSHSVPLEDKILLIAGADPKLEKI
jgi:hypothetical protein